MEYVTQFGGPKGLTFGDLKPGDLFVWKGGQEVLMKDNGNDHSIRMRDGNVSANSHQRCDLVTRVKHKDGVPVFVDA